MFKHRGRTATRHKGGTLIWEHLQGVRHGERRLARADGLQLEPPAPMRAQLCRALPPGAWGQVHGRLERTPGRTGRVVV